MSLDQICRDESLYGHLLLTLPHQALDFARGDLCLTDQFYPANAVVVQDYYIAKKVFYQKGNILTCRTISIIEKPLFDSIEFVARRIFGTLIAAICYLTLFPIGISAKVVHKTLL